MTHTDSSQQSCCCFPWSRFWVALGVLLVFLCAVIVVLYWAPEPPNDDAQRALLRVKNLAELRKSDHERLSTYAWVDQSQGKVRIPIKRAMELEIAGLNAQEWKPHATYPIAPMDLVSVPAGLPPTK